jgi:hypothetical protein
VRRIYTITAGKRIKAVLNPRSFIRKSICKDLAQGKYKKKPDQVD